MVAGKKISEMDLDELKSYRDFLKEDIASFEHACAHGDAAHQRDKLRDVMRYIRLQENTVQAHASPDRTQQISVMDAALRGLIIGPFSSIHIEFNTHACNYCTVEQAIADGMYDHVEWVSDAEKSNAVETNSILVLQWYPNTPVSYHCVAASTLDKCIAAAMKVQHPSMTVDDWTEIARRWLTDCETGIRDAVVTAEAAHDHLETITRVDHTALDIPHNYGSRSL